MGVKRKTPPAGGAFATPQIPRDKIAAALARTPIDTAREDALRALARARAGQRRGRR